MRNSTETPIARYGGWSLVAGASVGLGAAFAMESARQGFDVILLARRESALAETAARIRGEFGRRTHCITADLAQPDIGDRVERETRDLDVGLLVYNAAAEPEGPFLTQTPDDQRANLAVNCWAPTILCRQFGERMRARGRGALAIVSSMAALQGIKYFATYGAAKAYELILAEGLWDEFREFGVDVLGYVVGATASANFIGAAADAPYQNSSDASILGTRILQPAAPADVAARLFALLDRGPRQYSHDADERAAAEAAQQSRAEAVQAMGAVTVGLARFAHLR